MSEARESEPLRPLACSFGDDDLEELTEARYESENRRETDPVESLHRNHRARPVRARSRRYRAELPREARGVLGGEAAGVLTRATDAHAARLAAEVAELDAAVEWAALHPVSRSDVLESSGGERTMSLAGEGAPCIAEFAIAELALRLDVSTETGRHLIADALELAHRLPQCWEQLHSGSIPAYRARRVAQATRSLSPEAAAYVDGEVAPYLHSIGVKALEAIVTTAIWRFDLPRALEEAGESLDHRDLRVDLDAHPDNPSAACAVWGWLDRADAVELERAVAQLAHQLLLAGSSDSLEVRRSQALGMLARREDPIEVPVPDVPAEEDLQEWDEDDAETESEPVRVRTRPVVLYVHLSESALTGCADGALARLEGHAGPITVDQVRAWCQTPGSTTQITVKPVIDLAAVHTVGSYEVPAALAEQLALRDRTCVFPHCTRDARSCDQDHIEPHARGGPTASHNLAPLCRSHHRLKTHGEDDGWHYRMLHPGSYLWTTPGGHQVLRDPAGTHPL